MNRSWINHNPADPEPNPIMRTLIRVLTLIASATICGTSVHAASSYWDIDGAIPGPGGVTPAGTWDAATANWSADSTGSSATAAWTPGDTAIFAAGTDATGIYVVTVSGTQLASGVTVKEGAVTLSSGTISMDVVGGGAINILSPLSTASVISSVISGGANNQTVTISAAGVLQLTGANTYTGQTTINAGTVLIGGTTPLGTTAGNTVVNSGGAVLVNVTSVAEPIVLNGTGVAGAGALRSTGTRTWSGSVTLGSTDTKISTDSGQLTITGAISDGVSGANNYNLTLGGNGNTRLNTGTFNIGTGIITKEGTGSIQTEAGITAGGVNLNGGGLVFRVYSGALNAAAKTITVGPAAGISMGNVTFVGTTSSQTANNNIVNNNSALIVKAANNTTLTLAGQISGASGGLDVQAVGTGKVVLNNTETYGGDTKITTGTLQLGAAGSIANSPNINVASSATFDVSLVSFTLGASQTLKGAGTVNGPVTANGTLAPGASVGTAGTLTLNSALSLSSVAKMSYELMGNNTTVGGGINDLTSVGGNLTLDGTLNVAEIGAGSFLTAIAGDKWRIFNYTGSITDNGLDLGTMPTLSSGLNFQVDTATPNQVNLLIAAIPEPHAVSLLIAGLGLLMSRRVRAARRA